MKESIVFISRQIGKVKSPLGFALVLIFFISISWLGDGIYGCIEEGIDTLLPRIPILIGFIILWFMLWFMLFEKYVPSIIVENENKRYILISAGVIPLIVLIIGIITKLITLHQFQFLFSFYVLFAGWRFIANFKDNLRFSVKKIEPPGKLKPKALIIFLSYLSNQNHINAVRGIKNINDLRNPPNDKIPWRMPIEIIDKYKDTLKYVYVFGSENGSYDQITLFQGLVNTLFPNINVIRHDQPLDFEDLEKNLKGIEDAYKKLKEEKIDEKDIIIDLTEGQKIQSAAVGFSSLAYDRIFVYVSTNTYDIIAFDITVTTNES